MIANANCHRAAITASITSAPYLFRALDFEIDQRVEVLRRHAPSRKPPAVDEEAWGGGDAQTRAQSPVGLDLLKRARILPVEVRGLPDLGLRAPDRGLAQLVLVQEEPIHKSGGRPVPARHHDCSLRLARRRVPGLAHLVARRV